MHATARLYGYQCTACHVYDVTSVTHSRLARKIQTLIVTYQSALETRKITENFD